MESELPLPGKELGLSLEFNSFATASFRKNRDAPTLVKVALCKHVIGVSWPRLC
ncbi:hypothetical protein [Paraburkholderia sediminicola]|uniref:hypothetical protein n=1 Tax=Paraburkholderia sediminicola TaxID=458836 RepID=UPI0015FEDA70